MGDELLKRIVNLQSADGAVRLPGSSHAETALARRLDTGIAGNKGVVEEVFVRHGEQRRIGFNTEAVAGFRLNLHRLCRVQPGRGEADQSGQQQPNEQRRLDPAVLHNGSS